MDATEKMDTLKAMVNRIYSYAILCGDLAKQNMIVIKLLPSAVPQLIGEDRVYREITVNN